MTDSISTARPMLPGKWKWLWNSLVAVALVVLALRLVDRVVRHASSLPALPQPNGYDTLLAVARQVSTPQGDVAELGPDKIHQLAQANQVPLAKLHQALRSQTAVPLQVKRGWVDTHAADVKQLKRLAAVLGVQSHAAWLKGDTNASAEYLVDVILLGQALGRGGILSDGVNGLTVETVGSASLRAQAPLLSARTCREAAQELEQAEGRREAPEQVLKTERAWTTASFGLAGRVAGLFLGQARARQEAEFAPRYQEAVRRTRRLMLELASRARELETGKRPASAAELVPGLLRAVPLDPSNQAPMTEIPRGG